MEFLHGKTCTRIWEKLKDEDSWRVIKITLRPSYPSDNKTETATQIKGLYQRVLLGTRSQRSRSDTGIVDQLLESQLIRILLPECQTCTVHYVLALFIYFPPHNSSCLAAEGPFPNSTDIRNCWETYLCFFATQTKDWERGKEASLKQIKTRIGWISGQHARFKAKALSAFLSSSSSRRQHGISSQRCPWCPSGRRQHDVRGL